MFWSEDVIRFCDGRIAHYKAPEHVRMTVTGKPQKFVTTVETGRYAIPSCGSTSAPATSATRTTCTTTYSRNLPPSNDAPASTRATPGHPSASASSSNGPGHRVRAGASGPGPRRDPPLVDWLGGEKVYNPFDILLLFRQREFKAHWFETGTPRFLIDTLLRRGVASPELDGMVGTDALLSAFDVDEMAAEALLFQTGYLTIAGEEDVGGETLYRLEYPNHEVRQSLNRSLLRAMTPEGAHRAKDYVRHCIVGPPASEPLIGQIVLAALLHPSRRAPALRGAGGPAPVKR